MELGLGLGALGIAHVSWQLGNEMDFDLNPGGRSPTRPEKAPSDGSLHGERTSGRPCQRALLELRIHGEAVDEVAADPAGPAWHPQGPTDNLDAPGQVPLFAWLGELPG